MTLDQRSVAKTHHVLLVDDSPMYRMVILRDLMKRGFTQTAETILSLDNVAVHMIDNYADAMALISSASKRHTDFVAAFLDWHLSKTERTTGYDGVGLALAALDPLNQPLNPLICCVSGDVKEMIATLRKKVHDPAKLARIFEVDFINVVSKIMEITSPGATLPAP